MSGVSKQTALIQWQRGLHDYIFSLYWAGVASQWPNLGETNLFEKLS